MHLVVHQVVQLEHVHVTDGDRPIERLAGSTIIEDGLAALRQLSHLQQFSQFLFGGPVKDRSGDGYAIPQIATQRDQFSMIELAKINILIADGVVNFIEKGP